MEIRRNRKTAIIVMTALFILTVLIAAGTLGYYWYQKAHPAADETTTNGSGSISLNTPPKVETEQISTAMVIPKSTDKVGDTIKLSVLSMKTPKAWRTVNGKNVMNTSLDTVYAQSYNDILAQLIMVPESQPSDPVLPMNSFSLYNITSWLAKPSSGQKGTVTPATKALYIQNIANIGDGKAADKTVCDKGYGVLNITMCGAMLDAQPIATSDGSLRGVIFLNSTTQTATYDPQAIIFMTGKIKDQTVFGYGTFHLLDQTSHNLSATDTNGVKAAWDSLVKGTIPSDTNELYQHVINAIKSITIQAN